MFTRSPLAELRVRTPPEKVSVGCGGDAFACLLILAAASVPTALANDARREQINFAEAKTVNRDYRTPDPSLRVRDEFLRPVPKAIDLVDILPEPVSDAELADLVRSRPETLFIRMQTRIWALTYFEADPNRYGVRYDVDATAYRGSVSPSVWRDRCRFEGNGPPYRGALPSELVANDGAKVAEFAEEAADACAQRLTGSFLNDLQSVSATR